VKKKILITGATGFLGRQVVPLLEALGFEIHTAGRSTESDSSPSCQHHQCNLLNSETPASLIETIRPTHLLHLAWCADSGSFWNSPDNLTWLSSSSRLFEAFAQNGGQRAVGIGSCAEYDWSSAVDLSESKSAGRPSTLYGQAKRAASEWLQAISMGTSMSSAWGRLFFLYGPAAHPQRMPGAIIESLINGLPTPCPAGFQVRDYLYVKDAAQAIVRLIESEVAGPVNIASGRGIRVIDLIKAAGTATGNAHLLQVGGTPAQVSNNPFRIVADVHRLHDEVGYSPQVDLHTGMMETVEWCRNRRRASAD